MRVRAPGSYIQMAVSAEVRELLSQASAIPNNGVGVSEEMAAKIEGMVTAIEPECPEQPARRELRGVYDLLYCTGREHGSAAASRRRYGHPRCWLPPHLKCRCRRCHHRL